MMVLAFLGNAVIVPINLTGRQNLPGVSRTDSFNIAMVLPHSEFCRHRIAS